MSTDALTGALAPAGEHRRLHDGAVLCRQGELSTEAFVVLDGTVEATIDVDGTDVVVGSHGPGALVGEVTTVVGGTRTATLRASGPAAVSVVGKQVLSDWLDANPGAAAEVLALARGRTDRARVAAMLGDRLGPGSEDFAAAIADRMTWVTVHAGEELYRSGDAADGAYLVVSGQLFGRSGDDVVARYTRGDVVGAPGLFDDAPRGHTVVARRYCTLGRLSSDELMELTAAHPRAATRLTWRLREAMSVTASDRDLARTVAIVVTSAVSASTSAGLLSAMETAVAARSSTVLVSPAEVDRSLNSPGVAEVDPGGVGQARLAELLHQSEVDHDVVLLDGTTGGPNWIDRILRQADQVVVICSPSPSDAEAREIDAVTAAVDGLVPVWLGAAHRTADRPTATAELYDRFGVAEVHHLRPGIRDDVERLGRLAAGRGYALVLSGGGGRGFAHLGVIRSLAELGVPIDRVAGASMGSVIAAVVAAGFEGEALVVTVENQFKGLLDYTVPLVSLLKGERIAGNITDMFGEYDIEDLWLPFACTSTNLTRSRVEVHRRGPLHQAIRATVAIPGILPPVPYGEDLLIDGGVLDNLPIGVVSSDASVGTIIAVDVSPPTGPRAQADFGLYVSGWAAISDRVRPGRNRLPSLSSVLMRSVSVGAARARDSMIEAGTVDLYLDLDLEGVGLLEFENVRPIAERGYEAAHDRIREWLTEI